MESHIEDVGDTIDDIHLLFEVNSFSIVTNSCTSAQQGTHGLPTLGDDFLPDISTLFIESRTTNLEDFFDDLPLLFAEDDSSTIVAMAHSDPHFHSLYDQSL